MNLDDKKERPARKRAYTVNTKSLDDGDSWIIHVVGCAIVEAIDVLTETVKATKQ